jgi:hypothetical protein
MGEMENKYIILVGKLGGMRQFGRRRHRGEDKIQMELGK